MAVKRLVSYSGHEIKTLGKSDVAVEYKGRCHVIEFQVIDTDVIPLLGLQTPLTFSYYRDYLLRHQAVQMGPKQKYSVPMQLS